MPIGLTRALCALLTFTTASAVGAQLRPKPTTMRGLSAPVTLTRDSAGIVHIEAQNEHDLFFAQGYSAARDRLFQLELWRRQATGTMAEALGPRWVARDRASRLMAYRGSMATELAHYHPRGASIIQAFVDGINARVDEVRANPSMLPPDLAALGVTPGHWTPAVVVSRHNALANNATDEANTARAVHAIGEAAVARRRRYLPNGARLALDSAVARLMESVTDAKLFADYNASRTVPVFRANELDAAWRRPPQTDSVPPRDTTVERWESNNWVLSGARTASGKPIVANDPHRTISVPSLRYMVHLKAPGWNVIGGGEPAIPGVAIGHNEVGAWGLTIFAIDAEDLYVYELDAKNASYRYRGAWEPIRTVRDSIAIKGASPAPISFGYTRHGPVLYVDSAAHRAVALRAAWLEVGGAPYLASLRLDQARNWTEARAALSYARMPALNWIWADTSGAIGWQAAGVAPIRKSFDGLVPVPGDGRFEWAGFLPIAQLPHESNPARGFVGTANAFNVARTYAYFDAIGIGTWADAFRHDRIQQVLDTTRRATVARMAALQHDETPLAARALVPLIKQVEFSSALAKAARDTLLAWDGVLRIESRGAAIYAAWERRVSSHTADMVLPLSVRPLLRTVPLSRTIQWLTHPDSLLGERPEDARNFILFRAFNEAISDLRTRFGADIAAWHYGDVKFHHVRIAHPLDNLVKDSLRPLLSPGPLARGGYANTLNATGNTDNQTAGASFRVVMDLANWDSALATNTPGQSGDPRSPFYANLFLLWGKGEYVPLPFSSAAVRARSAEILTLSPARGDP